ncbi:MAG: hypothetical protein R2710_24625 [Acidimicrobiales bacterium]
MIWRSSTLRTDWANGCSTVPDAEVDGPLTDRFVSVVQAARLGAHRYLGRSHCWTTAPHLDLGAQSQAEVRCQLFTDAEPLRLQEPCVADRDTTEAWT